MIFVPTLPQSGTWFVLRLLEKCGYQIKFAGDIIMNDRILDMEKFSTALSTHIFPFYYQGSPFKEALPSYGGNPVQDYIVRKYHMCMGSIQLLASMYKTIIPIRDPLACLLTREARAPQLRHFYIVDGFLEVIKRFADNPNVYFLPVDLYSDADNRRGLIRRILIDCGIGVWGKNKEAIDKTAIEWKRENITPNNRFREPYEKGDISKIKEMLGSKWAEVEHLKNHNGTIMPFLRNLGYGELLW